MFCLHRYCFFVLVVAVIISRRNKKIMEVKLRFISIDDLVSLVKDTEHETVNRIINRSVDRIEDP